MSKIKVYIASDHGGFELKQQLKTALAIKFDFIDLGCDSSASVDYPQIAFNLCEKVIKDNIPGILICGTGIGMNICANKVKGIRAANLVTPKMASLAKEHNDCNVICLSGRFVSLSDNIKIINNFFNANFNKNDQINARHVKRLSMITSYENKK